MRKTISLAAAALMAMTVGAPASFAKEPTGYYDKHHVWHSYHRVTNSRVKCEAARQHASNRGAVLGGLGGAVLGSAIAGHGAKTEGAVIGGVGGVLAGRQLAKKNHRC
jgi:glycine zipper 2TM protein